MTPRITRTIVATAALGALALAPSAAPGDAGRAAALKKITAAGVGQVKLGKTFTQLHGAGLVGRLRPGCELSGPNVRFAKLKAPLSGTVDFTRTSPRRAKRVTVRGGAAARGVGIGATISDIKTAFPKATVDHTTEQLFGITLVKVPKDGGGRIQFAVDVDTDKTTLIAVPRLAFCE
jgi:hypothetical protein